jgi:hypothetical protein
MSHLPKEQERRIAKMMRKGVKSKKTPRHLKKFMKAWLKKEGFR